VTEDFAPDERVTTDGDRLVDFADDDLPILPESTRDDTDEGWGERVDRRDDWIREQRPPHWD
jgi:hypothetical protein